MDTSHETDCTWKLAELKREAKWYIFDLCIVHIGGVGVGRLQC